MTRRRSRSALRSGLLLAAPLGAFALLWVLAEDRMSGGETVVAPLQTTEARPELEPPVLPLPLPVRPLEVEPLSTAPPESSAAAPLLAERVERAVAELAATLHDGPVDRSTWETGVRALAGSLGPDVIPPLLELAADGSRPDEHLVAAAELLRVASVTPGTLPEPALDALRRSLDERPRRPLATAATRALAALGTRDDTLRLLDELVDPESRSLAGWGLQVSPDVAILDDLGGLLATHVDVASREAVLTTMEAWARAAGPARLDAPARDAAAAAVAALADDASVEPGLRRRAAAALATLGGAAARTVFEAICADPAADDGSLRIAVAALAVDADPMSAVLLEDGLWSASTSETRRLAFAEGLALRGFGPARQLLSERAATSSQTADQRRALYALGALPAGADTVSAASIALGHPDPAVRAAGHWALERTAPAPARTR